MTSEAAGQPKQDSAREQKSRPESPPRMATQAWNVVRALTAFVSDGMKTVTEQQYRQRLEICDGCDRRRGNRCLKCGCRLSLKAQGRAFQCPLGKWPEV